MILHVPKTKTAKTRKPRWIAQLKDGVELSVLWSPYKLGIESHGWCCSHKLLISDDEDSAAYPALRRFAESVASALNANGVKPPETAPASHWA